jgi:hypothetical protein
MMMMRRRRRGRRRVMMVMMMMMMMIIIIMMMMMMMVVVVMMDRYPLPLSFSGVLRCGDKIVFDQPSVRAPERLSSDDRLHFSY